MENKLYQKSPSSFSRWMLLMSCIALCLFAVNANAQLTGTKTIPTDYPTLAAAITDLNLVGVGVGGVIINQAGVAETAPAGGYVINLNPAFPASLANPVVIQGSGAVITAFTPQVTGSLVDAIFKIIGEDNVTIRNFSMLENAANLTTTAASNNMTEFGVALFYRTVTDGAQNCTVLNNTITLNRTYQNTWGIYSNSTHTTASITTSATATGTTGGNSGLKIYGNTISNVNQGICVVGPTGTLDFNNGLDIGGTGGVQANSITNWGTTGTFSGYANVSGTLNAILVRNACNYNVSYNTLTSSVGGNTATASQRAVYVPAFSTTPTGTFTNSINNNIISVQSGFLTGTLNGIIVEGTTASATSSITINNNDFNTFQHTSATASGAITFINSTFAYLNTTISGNTFTALNVKTTGSITFVSNSITVLATGSQTVTSNNIVTSFIRTSAGTTTCFTTGSSSVAGATNSWSNNNFSNITLTGSSSFTFIANSDGGGVNTVFSGNTLNNVGFTGTTVSTSTITGMTVSFGGQNGGVGKLLTGNTITNITSSGPITGIICGSSTKLTATLNTINNLSSVLIAGLGGGTVQGMTVSSPTADINNNTITNLSTAGASSTLAGIVVTSGTTSTLIDKNTISGLTGTGATLPVANGISVSSGTAVTLSNNVICNVAENGAVNIATAIGSAVNGILISGGTLVTALNNRIGDLRAPASFLTSPGTENIRGINITSTTASSTYKIYNNTVNLTAAFGGANFGTAGIFHAASTTATTATLDLRNNIIANTSVHNGGGASVAYRRNNSTNTGGAAGMLANYASTSNNNDFWVTGGGAGLDQVYNDGTVLTTIVAYKTGAPASGTIAPRDASSFGIAPPFISTTCGNANFLKITTGVATQLESGGSGAGLSFTTDFEGETRAGNGGYVGTGTDYDVGADEFAGLPATPTITSVTASPLGTQCVAVNRTITADITPVNPLASAPTLTFAYNGGAPTTINMAGGSLVAQSLWTATLPAAVPGNAIVTWSVFATDGSLSKIKAGLSYSDQPNDILGISATATPGAVCAYSASVLNLNIGGSQVSPTYVNPTAATSPTADEDMGNITITQGATTVLNNTSTINTLVGTIGTATGTAGGYSNFTSFGPYTLGIGGTYNFSISSVTTGTAFGNAIAFWIDYNRDGVFTQANEAVYNQGATISGAHTVTGSFTVPITASPGVCRLRVLVNEGTITSPTQAVSFGEWEEYLINLGGVATSYSWSDGANVVGTTNPVTVYPPATTTYTGTAIVNNCPMSASVIVTTNPIPSAPTTVSSTQCGAGVPTASVASTTGLGSPNFRWYLTPTGTGGTAIQTGTATTLTTYSISSTTTFYVSENDPALGCESQRTPVVVTVNQPDPITASASANNICPLTSFNLLVAQTGTTNTYSYSWNSASSGSGLSGPTPGAPVTGTLSGVQATTGGSKSYTVTATDGPNGCVTTSTVVVTFLTNPLITVTPATTTVCPNTPVQLNVTQSNGGGQAYLFNGSTQYIAIPHTASLSMNSPAAQSLTLEAWVKETALPVAANSGIISHYQSGAFASYFLRTGSVSPYSAIGAGASSEILSPIGSMTAGTWRHVAATFTYNAINLNEDVKIYIDGIQVATGSSVVPLSTDSLKIGSDFGARYFNGTIDEVRIWNTALSPATLLAWKDKHVLAGHPNFANLAAYYDFDATSSTTVTDLSGNGNTGYLRTIGAGVVATQVSGAPISYITSYAWSPTGGLSDPSISNPVATVASTTTYTVTVTGPNGCNAQGTSVINTIVPPAAPSIVSNTPQCGYGVPNAVVTTGGFVMRWYLVPTGGTALAGQSATSLSGYYISSTTTFYVAEYDGSCESSRTPVVAVVTQPDAITATATSPNCTGTLFTLNVSKAAGPNTYSYAWNGGSVNSGVPVSTPGNVINGHLDATALAAGTYTYTVIGTDVPNNCAAITNVIVTIYNYPLLDSLVGVPMSLCSGQLVTLNAYSAYIGTGPQTSPSYAVVTGASTPTVDEDFGNITITQGANTILNNTSTINSLVGTIGTAAGIAGGYSDFTGFGPYTVVSGQTYSFSLSSLTTGTSFGNAMAIYIDYNRNGDFLAANEAVYNQGATISGPHTVTGSFTIPSGASAGVTRMRVIVNEGTISSATQAVTWGEYEDYNLNIQAIVPQNPTLSYSWSAGVAGVPSYTATDSPINAGAVPIIATYTVSVSSNGCVTKGSKLITVNPLPATPVATNDAQCGPGIPTCYVTGGAGLFRWYYTPTGGTPIAGESGSNLSITSIPVTTTFYVSEYDGSCESARVPVVQTVSNAASVNVFASSPVCAGSVLNLTVTQSPSYPWLFFDWTASPLVGSGLSGNPQGGNPIDGHLNITPTVAGTYTYSILASDGVCSAGSSVVVTVAAPPVLNSVTAAPTTVCSGDAVTLNAYSPVIGTGPQTSPTYAVVTGASTPTVDEDFGNITITQGASTILNNTSLINDLTGTIGTATGTAGGYSNFTGFGPYTVVSGQTYSFSLSSLTTGTSFGNAMAIYIDYDRNGDFLAANEAVYNQGATISGPHTVTGSFTIPSGASAGVTRMRVIVNEGTISSATQAVTWGEYEDYNLNVMSIIPQNPALIYTWTPGGGTTQTTVVNPLNPGNTAIVATYTVNVSNGTCSSNGSVTINVNPLPPTPTATPSSQCGFGTPTCSVTGSLGGPFSWYLTPTGGTALSGQSAATLSAYPIGVTTTFYVSEYDGTCSSGRVAVVANVTAPDAITAAASAAPYCANSVISLTQTKAAGPFVYNSWTWSASPATGSGLTIPTAGNVVNGNLNVTPTTAGTYTYTVQATDGACSTTSTIVITVGAQPPVSATTSASQICSGSSATLSAVSQILGTGPQTLPVGYCAVTNAGSSCITSVQINTLNSTPPGCVTPFFHANAPTAGNTTSLVAGQNYTINLVTGGTSIISVWIDYNRDGVYDASEWVQPWTVAASGSATISVPILASSGVTGMRVRSRLNGNANGSGDACLAMGSGSTEDYQIEIISLVQNPQVTFSWNPGGATGTPIIVSPASSTTYVVTGTDGNSGCSATASVAVNVITISAAPTVVTTTTYICISGTVGLSITPPQVGVTYNWESSPTGLPASWTSLGAGTGPSAALTSGTLTANTYFQLTASCGASSFTTTPVLITVDNPHVISSSGGTRCGSGYVTASVTGVGSFNWFANSTGGTALFSNQSTINPLVTVPSTTLWVEAFSGTCIAPFRFPVSIGFTPSPAITLTAPATICDNQTLTLTASSTNPGYTYQWSTNGGASIAFSGNPYILNPSVTSTYTLIATDNSGGANNACSNVASKVVTVYQAPPVPVITPAAPAICSTGGCVNLTVAGAVAQGPGTVSIGNGTLTNGTTGYPAPYGQFFTGDREQMLILASELQAQGLVAGNLTGLAFDVLAPPGPFTVGNLSSLPLQNFTIKVGATGVPALTTTFQTGLTQVYSVATYNAVAGVNTHTFNTPFLWDGISNIVVETCYNNDNGSCPTGSTNYGTNAQHYYTTTSFVSATYSFADGSCTICGTATGTTSSNRPNVKISGITGSPITYTWNPGSVIGISYNVCPTANTTYTVVASVPTGCTSSASVAVQYTPIPNPNAGAVTICQGSSTTLDAGAGFTNYSWSPGGATTQTITVSPSSTTTYTVTVDNGALCTKTASHVVTVTAVPTPIVSATPNPVCAGSSVSLSTGTYATYSWNDGAGVVSTSNPYSASPASTTTYTVTVTISGCPATSSPYVVVVGALPPASITPAGPISLCDDGSNSPLILTSNITGAGAGSTIVWNQDGSPVTATISVSAGDVDLAANAGTFGYNFTVTDGVTGCVNTSNTVTVNEVPCAGPTLYVKAWIEGYYGLEIASLPSLVGVMDNATNGPAGFPPLGGCLFHNGLSANPLDADYVILSAMNPVTYNLVEAQTGIIKTNGKINVTFTNAVSKTLPYYIRVQHRNSIETWSASPVVLGNTTALSPYDFTDAASKAYASNQIDIGDLYGQPTGTVFAIFSGDVSPDAGFPGAGIIGLQDGIVSSDDYGLMETALYFTYLGYVQEDITGDGIVSSEDYGLMETNTYYTRIVHSPVFP